MEEEQTTSLSNISYYSMWDLGKPYNTKYIINCHIQHVFDVFLKIFWVLQLIVSWIYLTNIITNHIFSLYRFQQNLAAYQNMITQSMYDKQLDSGKGTLLHLCDDVIQQEVSAS
jgi:hypothetical protein